MKGHGPRQVWGSEICSGFCCGIFGPASKRFPVVKKFRRVFCRQRRRCNGTPRKTTMNFAIAKFVSRRNRIPRQFCLRAFVAANFAGNGFSPRISPAILQISPAPFFAGNSFRRTDPSCSPQKHPLGPAASFFRKASKAAPSYLYAPRRCW